MLTLCLDTAYKYLTCVLMEDEEIIEARSFECFKRQSEEVFMVLDEILKASDRKILDIDSICITKGPGSYTGVRIAMTIAKVIASVKGLDLYTISTLRLYANAKANTMVLMDARASRAYVGVYDGLNIIKDDSVQELKEIDCGNYDVIGDGHLIEKEDKMFNIAECFKNTKAIWEKVDDIDHLVPAYLKESESYYR